MRVDKLPWFAIHRKIIPTPLPVYVTDTAAGGYDDFAGWFRDSFGVGFRVTAGGKTVEVKQYVVDFFRGGIDPVQMDTFVLVGYFNLRDKIGLHRFCGMNISAPGKQNE